MAHGKVSPPAREEKPRFRRAGNSLVLISVLFLSFLFGAGCRKASQSVGDTALDFTLSDISGRQVSLSAFKGKVIVLEFWATWCPPCQTSVPELAALHEKYKERGAVVIGVAVDDSMNSIASFAMERKIPYTVLLDDKDVGGLYRISSIPVTLIIDRKGAIISRHTGYSPDMFAEISQKIEAAL